MAAALQPWQILVAALAGWISREQDAIIQHARLWRRLRGPGYAYVPPLPLGLITATLLLLIGVFGLVAIFL